MLVSGITLEEFTRKLEPLFSARVPITVSVTGTGKVYSIIQPDPPLKEEKGRLKGVKSPAQVFDAIKEKLPRGYTPLNAEVTDTGVTYRTYVPSVPD